MIIFTVREAYIDVITNKINYITDKALHGITNKHGITTSFALTLASYS